MRPTHVAWRLLSALLLVVAVIARPGESLTHGVAHQREHHHEAWHDAAHGTSQGTSTADVEPPAVSTPGHGHEHVHGDVDDASTRNRIDPQATATEVELPASAMRDIAVAAAHPRTPLAGGESSTGPPPRLRAPPTR